MNQKYESELEYNVITAKAQSFIICIICDNRPGMNQLSLDFGWDKEQSTAVWD